MYMSREIIHCKPGKAKDLMAVFKKMAELMKKKGLPTVRIYTDVSGERYWTVVVEQDVQNIDELAEMSRQAMADKEFVEVFKGYHEFVESGKGELYKVE